MDSFDRREASGEAEEERQRRDRQLQIGELLEVEYRGLGFTLRGGP